MSSLKAISQEESNLVGPVTIQVRPATSASMLSSDGRCRVCHFCAKSTAALSQGSSMHVALWHNGFDGCCCADQMVSPQVSVVSCIIGASPPVVRRLESRRAGRQSSAASP